MTPRQRSTLVALLSRVAERGGKGDSIFTAKEVLRWPKGAVQTLLNVRLLRDLPPAEGVTCPYCTERCRRPVVIGLSQDGREQRATWTCHLYDDFGPFDEPAGFLRRWGCSRQMVAKFFGRALRLELRDHDPHWRRITFSTLKVGGLSRAISLEFDGCAVVKIGSESVNLVNLLEWDEHIAVDRAALTATFEASEDIFSGSKRFQPSTAVRDDRRLETQLRERRLQKRMDTLAAQHSRLNKEQLAKKIVQSGQGEGLTAARIARVTRRPKKSRRKNFA